MEKATFDYSKLRGKIREVFKTQEAFACALGISAASMSAKLNNAVMFTPNEMVLACVVLGLSVGDIPEYFFAQQV